MDVLGGGGSSFQVSMKAPTMIEKKVHKVLGVQVIVAQTFTQFFEVVTLDSCAMDDLVLEEQPKKIACPVNDHHA